MVLNFGGMTNIFDHSREFDQGLGGVRTGQATVVVSQDGTGDAASIQEGIDLLPKTGGVVYIKEGTYTITEKITIDKDNSILIGASRGAIIRTDLAIDILEINASYITIQELTINGNIPAAANLAENGITLINAKAGINIVRCNILNLEKSGILMDDGAGGGADIKITGCTISGTIKEYGIDTQTYRRCIIVGNKIGGGDIAGIHSNGFNNIISGNIVIDCGIGIHMESTENIMVFNELINNTTNYTDDGTNTQIGHNITT